jgi:hypothetical protein
MPALIQLEQPGIARQHTTANIAALRRWRLRRRQWQADAFSALTKNLLAGVAGQARPPGNYFPTISAVSRQRVFTFMQQFGLDPAFSTRHSAD